MVSGAPEQGRGAPPVEDRACAHGVDLAGRYRVGSLLRVDGRCCIHEGRDVLLQRPVSVTLATPERGIPIPRTLSLPTSAQHGHGPGLGEIYDGGDDDGTLYLITQLPEGGTLAEELSRHHLSAGEVRELGAGIARALLPAHRRGWAHGALEADTVALGPDRVVVAGLGVGEWLAHWAQVEDRPRHPAPEQLADREISPATDVFALGALLAEAAEPLPPTDPLVELLGRMRADDPAQRPATEEVLRLLTDPDGFPAPPPDEARVALVPHRRPDARTAPTVAALGGLAVAAALALATLLVHPSDASPEQVVGGATVASSAADPQLPGPLPLLLPPMARHTITRERTTREPTTPDARPVAATADGSGSRNASGSRDDGAGAGPTDAPTRSTTPRSDDDGNTGGHPQPTSAPSTSGSQTGDDGTGTTSPGDHGSGDDGTGAHGSGDGGTGDPTTSRHPGTSGHRHPDGLGVVTGSASATASPDSASVTASVTATATPGPDAGTAH